jgi:indoleamine 2,3-dioxygenase
MLSDSSDMTQDLGAYEVDAMRGFLPTRDPLERLPIAYEAWEAIAPEIPSLLATRRLRPAMEGLAIPDFRHLEEPFQLHRAMLLLSFFGNAYVWGDYEPAARLPRAIAIPWCNLADRLGRPPIASHASIALYNWRLIDNSQPLSLDNLAPLQLFTGTPDEEWFYVTTVAIEAKGAPALLALVKAQSAVQTGCSDVVVQSLQQIAKVLEQIQGILVRMTERCQPAVFYQRIRPFLSGWPAGGVVYEGVSEEPQHWAGGSAAQSSLLQAFDAGLAVKHQDEAARFLDAMWDYMPPPHRKFVQSLAVGPSVRQFVLERRLTDPGLCELYNDCIRALAEFRRTHIEIASLYIVKQSPKPEEAKGTGGSHFITFLRTAWTETKAHLII